MIFGSSCLAAKIRGQANFLVGLCFMSDTHSFCILLSCKRCKTTVKYLVKWVCLQKNFKTFKNLKSYLGSVPTD